MEIIVLLGFLLIYFVLLILALAMAILQVISQWKLFEKAGEHGWASLIPMYNYFVMVKIATGNYTLGWVYLGIYVVYMVLSIASGFIKGFSADSETVSFEYIMIMLVLMALMIPVCIIAGYVSYMFGKSYGKSTAWNVCMIFFSPILMIIMGFDKNTTYIGAKGIPQNYT